MAPPWGHGSDTHWQAGGGLLPALLLQCAGSLPRPHVECGWQECSPPQAPGLAVGPSPHPNRCGPNPCPVQGLGENTALENTWMKKGKCQKPLQPPACGPHSATPPSSVLTGLARGLGAPATCSPRPHAQAGTQSYEVISLVGGHVLWQQSGWRATGSLRTVGVGLHHLAVHGHGEGQAQDLQGQESWADQLPGPRARGTHPTRSFRMTWPPCLGRLPP